MGKLIGISFVKDGREIPEELEKVSTVAPDIENSAEGSGEDQKLHYLEEECCYIF